MKKSLIAFFALCMVLLFSGFQTQSAQAISFRSGGFSSARSFSSFSRPSYSSSWSRPSYSSSWSRPSYSAPRTVYRSTTIYRNSGSGTAHMNGFMNGMIMGHIMSHPGYGYAQAPVYVPQAGVGIAPPMYGPAAPMVQQPMVVVHQQHPVLAFLGWLCLFAVIVMVLIFIFSRI